MKAKKKATRSKKKKTPLKARIIGILGALLSCIGNYEVVQVPSGFHTYSRKNPTPKPRPKKDQADT